MKKSVLNTVLLFAVSMFVGVSRAQEGADAASPLYAQSQPFATADEAAMFANMHPFGPRWGGAFPEFLCEFADGAPMTSSYRVVYANYEAATTGDPQWKAKEGFATLEEAKDFVNANHLGIVQFVPCWNPYRTPASTTITVFYLHALHGESITTRGDAYRIWGGPFASPREAAEYAGEHLSHDAYVTAQFVPQLFATKQTESLWYVIALDFPRASNRNTRNEIWRVEESDENKFPFSVESALAFRNEHVENELQSAVSTFSTAFLRSRVVIFRLLPASSGEETNETATEDLPNFRAETRAALLGIPAKLYVDEALFENEPGAKTMGIPTTFSIEGPFLDNVVPPVLTPFTDAAQAGFEAFFAQTQIAVWGDRMRSYTGNGRNPMEIARTIPHAPRSLNIFFSATPPSPSDHYRTFKPGLRGEKFLIIWVRPSDTKDELVSALIHSLAHKFTAQDVADPSSAMFFDGGHTGSSSVIDRGNLVLIRQMALLAKRWGSVDIAFALN